MYFPANQYKRPRKDKRSCICFVSICDDTTPWVIFVTWNQIQSADLVQIGSGFKKSQKSQVQDDSHWAKAGILGIVWTNIVIEDENDLWAEECPDADHLLDDSLKWLNSELCLKIMKKKEVTVRSSPWRSWCPNGRWVCVGRTSLSACFQRWFEDRRTDSAGSLEPWPSPNYSHPS